MYKFRSRNKRGAFMILIDNYDSFTYNIVQYLQELGIEPQVFENDKISINELKQLNFSSIIISPGAGNPNTAGISMEVIKEFYKTKKILGVCLGFQCLAQFFGAEIIKDKEPMHGKVSNIEIIENSKLFKNIPNEFFVTRYHSLIANRKTIKPPLKITAQTKDHIVMAIEHNKLPLYGVQFHPEAILTQYGHELFENFISI